MNPPEIVRRAKLDGVNLTLSKTGNIFANGEGSAIRKWSATIKASKPEILAYLAGQEAKVRLWLERIGENDPVIIDHVLTVCRENSDALAYFLGRAVGRGC